MKRRINFLSILIFTVPSTLIGLGIGYLFRFPPLGLIALGILAGGHGFVIGALCWVAGQESDE